MRLRNEAGPTASDQNSDSTAGASLAARIVWCAVIESELQFKDWLLSVWLELENWGTEGGQLCLEVGEMMIPTEEDVDSEFRTRMGSREAEGDLFHPHAVSQDRDSKD